MKTRTRGRLSPEQRAAFVLLLFLGLGGVVLGFFSFGANIRKPFDLQIAGYKGDRILPTAERDRAAMEALKNRDTDGDGLSDYDEIHVFRTSPYLADTDSDGIDDKTEIYAGTDPNCPQGKECGGAYVSADVAADPSGTAADDLLTRNLGAFGSFNLENPDDIVGILQDLSLEQVRASLLQQGVPQETLDKIDDETLRELITEAVNDASGSDLTDIVQSALSANAEE